MSDESWHLMIDLFMMQNTLFHQNKYLTQEEKIVRFTNEQYQQRNFEHNIRNSTANIRQYKIFFETLREWQNAAQQDVIFRQKFDSTLYYILQDLEQFEKCERNNRNASNYFDSLDKLEHIKKEYKLVPKQPDLEEILEYMRQIQSLYYSTNKTFNCFVDDYKSTCNRSRPVIANLRTDYNL